MYQHKVDVDMLSAVKSVLADVFRVLALRQSKDEGLMLKTYSHQPYVDTFYILLLR